MEGEEAAGEEVEGEEVEPEEAEPEVVPEDAETGSKKGDDVADGGKQMLKTPFHFLRAESCLVSSRSILASI